jgi:diguanylate cyclase (GGDEF)-like protein
MSGYEKTLFAQDNGVAIFVLATTNAKLAPGDRILVRGTTQSSFRPLVISKDITLLHHGALPQAVQANFDELIQAKLDCMFVVVHARVRSADLELSLNAHVRNIEFRTLTDGGYVDATIDSDDADALKNLLDADVEITGVASGRFDGKMQITGVLLHVSKLADVRVLKRTNTSPWSLPVARMDEILNAYHVQTLSQRIRVQGAITYYEPGSAIVLQNGSKSLWIKTQTFAPMRIGDLADAIGFPGLNDGFLILSDSEIQDSQINAPIIPRPVTWRQLTSSGRIFDLVSIEGEVVTAFRGPSEDEYALVSDGYIFSAISHHTNAANAPTLDPMKRVPVGSKVRVTGICVLDNSNPFGRDVPFNILMRSPDDITVVAKPNWLNTGNLIRVVGVLLLVVFVSVLWGAALDRKVRRQTAALSARIAAEAALERRTTQIEQQRSQILEDINGTRPLTEILDKIFESVSFRLNGAPCWCEFAGGPRFGKPSTEDDSRRMIQEDIPARSGPPLGTLFVTFDLDAQPCAEEAKALTMGTRLASVAIETRRLFSDLVHRSEFDLLTDIQNRFSLDKHLDALIDSASQAAGIFGLIYVDLDEFKQVNDEYGHQVGDLYLQEVAMRMKRQLRPGDMLARLGGDEFAVLVPIIRCRADVEEIALRLERCFEGRIAVEGYILRGSASVGIALYPADGNTKDSLLDAADAAMYVSKNNKRQMVAKTSDPEFKF